MESAQGSWPAQIAIFLLVAATGTAVVVTRDPLAQSMVASLYGMLLSILFLVLQAPDVALSEIVVGAVAYPLMVVIAVAKTTGRGRNEPDTSASAFLPAAALFGLLLVAVAVRASPPSASTAARTAIS